MPQTVDSEGERFRTQRPNRVAGRLFRCPWKLIARSNCRPESAANIFLAFRDPRIDSLKHTLRAGFAERVVDIPPEETI